MFGFDNPLARIAPLLKKPVEAEAFTNADVLGVPPQAGAFTDDDVRAAAAAPMVPRIAINSPQEGPQPQWAQSARREMVDDYKFEPTAKPQQGPQPPPFAFNAPAPPANSAPPALSPGGQQFQRIAMNAVPQVDTTYHGAPEASSNPAAELPVEPSRAGLPRVSAPDLRIAESNDLYSKYGGGGQNETALAQMEAANIANKGRGPQRNKGAGAWFKDMGRSALRGFIKGGIGGAIGGAIRGGIDPQFANEAKYYEHDMPQARAAANDERIAKSAGLNRVQDIAGMTERLPGGSITAQGQERISRNEDRDADRQERTRTHEYNNRIRQDQLDRGLKNDTFNERIRQDTLDERGESRREQAARNHVAMAQSSGSQVDPAAVKGTTYETYAGKVPPKVGAGGEDGLTTYQRVQIERGDRDDEDRRREKVLGRGGMVDEYEALTQQAADANSAATRLHNERSGSGGTGLVDGTVNAKGEITGQKVTSDADEQEAWDKVKAINVKRDALRQKLGTEHGDIVEVGKDYVKPKERAARAAAAPQSNKPAARISQSEYQKLVEKHGKEKVDAVLAKKGVSIQ